MYICKECNGKEFKRKVNKTNIKLNILKKILIFLRILKDPNFVSEERVCPHCQTAYSPEEMELQKVEHLPYYQKKFLMTKAEQLFFQALTKAIPEDVIVIPQVSLSSIINTKDRSFRNKIDRKSVDFVLFKNHYFNPLLIVELDDKTHERQDRMERDLFVDQALLKAGLPILHIKTSYQYDTLMLQELITHKLKIWQYQR